MAWGRLTVIVALGVAFAIAGHAGVRAAQPGFDETACDLPGISPEIRPRLRCGTVAVPRNHASPDAGQFKLAVVAVKSAQQPSLPDPVVYISGGPGNPLTIYAAHQARTPYAPNRDLILMDQRGTGRSEPDLCPDLNARLLETSLTVAANPAEDERARRRAAYAACRETAIGRGLDPHDFGTRVTAEDYEWVRRALGVQRWNVYGESYGTTVAMMMIALYPDRIRAAVLDSLYPPDPMPLWSTLVADARAAFFASCSGSETCGSSFPDLAATYREAVSMLARTPLSVSVPPSMRRPDNRVDLTASLFEAVIGNLIYYPTAYPGLPRLIAAARDGDTRDFGSVLASIAAGAASLSYATRAAVECRDRPLYRVALSADASPLDRLQLNDICEGWSDLGPPPLVPAGTGVPTLVLVGQFDPVAGVPLSRQITERIGKSARLVEFPLVGHNVRAFSPCGTKVAADFIDDPARALDSSCAARVAPIRFLPRRQAP